VLRVSDYWFYYRAIQQAFLEQQASFDPDAPPPFPGLADYRHWTSHVTKLLEDRDDVSLVANIRTVQIEKLAAAGITTLHGLAESTLPTVLKMAKTTFDRLRAQAKIQMASKPEQPPAFKVLPINPEAARQGFGLLPPESAHDVCFDIEGYPLIDGGLEYLLGATCREHRQLVFKDWWAHDREQERASFESFVDWVHDRWKQEPSMHVYHYAAYETTALKRLMCRYASRENEVDDLLRNHVFVDLYTVVRQALLIGEPSYSLKNVEHLYMPKREGEVATAGESIVFYHRWMEAPDGKSWQDSSTLKLIRDYNKVDCDSTWELVTWMREQQGIAGRRYVAPAPPNEVAETTSGRAAVAQEMLAAIPKETDADPERWRVHALLAHLLEFHRREHKSLYWAMFERAEMTEQELIEDSECLGAVQRTKAPPVQVKQSFSYEYAFPEQESKLRAGSRVCLAEDTNVRFEIEDLDYDRRTLIIKRGRRSGEPPRRINLIPNEIVDAKAIVGSIERTVREYNQTGSLPKALGDFLYRHHPRLARHGDGPIISNTEEIGSAAINAVKGMRRTTLCIQGPPGSGKTHTGGQIIAELLKAGNRVGISSNSHEAICVLMRAVGEAADETGIRFAGAKCGQADREQFHPSISILATNSAVFETGQLPDLVGGTAWLFSKEEAAGQFDYLFIDEAGQVSVANLVGVAPCAKNLVLLGDQMQLGQPIQGVHPGESGQSVLEYYLQDHATIPDDLGIFLPTTWRMRPEVCAFISAGVYEGRLTSEPSTLERSIRLTGQRRRIHKAAGLVYVPVDHDGDTFESDDEAVVVQELVSELCGHTLDCGNSAPRRLSADDILVVAPFNLQVRKLQAALPGIRVGTVDKFQGQQAPVVIFSMTASEGDSAPRGIEFLFDSHRLNVAISRAQILAVIVASPKLERTRTSNLEQMKLVNLFCRAAQEGEQTVGATGMR
jgi:uncharacterized protein